MEGINKPAHSLAEEQEFKDKMATREKSAMEAVYYNEFLNEVETQTRELIQKCKEQDSTHERPLSDSFFETTPILTIIELASSDTQAYTTWKNLITSVIEKMKSKFPQVESNDAFVASVEKQVLSQSPAGFYANITEAKKQLVQDKIE